MQNVQARSRMVLSFLMAQLGPLGGGAGGSERSTRKMEEMGAAEEKEEQTAQQRRRRSSSQHPPPPSSEASASCSGQPTSTRPSGATSRSTTAPPRTSTRSAAVSKTDLRAFLKWAASGLGYPRWPRSSARRRRRSWSRRGRGIRRGEAAVFVSALLLARSDGRGGHGDDVRGEFLVVVDF